MWTGSAGGDCTGGRSSALTGLHNAAETKRMAAHTWFRFLAACAAEPPLFFVGDAGSLDMENVAIQYPGPKPAFFYCDVNQTGASALRQCLAVGLNKPVILLDRDKLKQHEAGAGSFANPKTLLVRTDRAGRNCERSR